MNRFICIIQDKRICPHIKDRLVWRRTKDSLFYVKSLFDELELLVQPCLQKDYTKSMFTQKKYS